MSKKMNNKKNTKRTFVASLLSLMLCMAMFIGTTFAWFTDNVTSSSNIIKSGNLDLEMYWTDDLESGEWYDVEDPEHNTIFNHDNWEPGYTEVRYIKIVNAGNLAFNYNITLTPKGEVGKLAEVINVFYANNLSNLNSIGLLSNVMNGGAAANGTLLAANQESPLHQSGETIITLAMNMITTAGNEYQDESIGDGFTITALATQCPFEEDSFGSDYDSNAEYPEILLPGQVSATVTPENGKVPTGGVTLAGNGLTATVPEGVVLENGANKLTLSVTPLENTTSNITVVNNEILIPVDVHIEGVAEDNTVPIIIELGAIMPKYLNMGNYTLIHVENGANETMTYVEQGEELTAHNQFKYDPLTGEVTVAMASFSEVAVIANTAKPWEGGIDEEFSGAGSETDPYIIATADELAGLGRKISNDNANYGAKHYKLISDINIGGKGTGHIFYPIGYWKQGEGTNKAGEPYYTYGGSFEGTFDGAGHTITGIYQNTWAMDGDYDAGYYNDAMGLFGYVNGGTVRNLTIDNFYSEGEFAPTGCVTAYAAGKTMFENIAITSSEPQTYNTGVAGIVGWDNGGDSEAEASNFTFKNITIDDSNTISALWGSWDVAAAGVSGYLGEYSKATLDNCHVAATIDVYNDVCGNYQYYWYRYCGMMIGTVDKTQADGSLDLSNITATNCSVNFGERHEYYYCEFVKNSIASYTHDYQFSRVSHSELNLDDDPVTCNHDHAAQGKEVIDGVEVLVEDKQAVYIPFRQLFGGYGWGVDGVDINEYENIEISDLTTSIAKFEKADSAKNEYFLGETVTIGELFTAVDEAKIRKGNVQVFVSPVGEESTAGGEYKADTTNWENGTLTFSGLGDATISITDYYFCQTKTINITVKEPETVDKFAVKFKNTDKYLYRVGNANEVKLGSLFKEIDGVTIGNVTVEVTKLGGNASGTYTADSNWAEATLKFTGTGPVAVTIKDDKYSKELVLNLEVVDATNVTSYSGLANKNSVLLNDIEMASGSSYYLSGATLYGNGFTFDVTNGAYAGTGSLSNNYLISLNNASLDNVQIKGAVYTSYGAQVKDNYNRVAVLSMGNNTISNCHISNCASPVRVNGGNIEIVNTTLKGGNFANLDIRNGHVVLDNVTTINQVNGNDKAEGETVVVGLGVVVYYENVLSTTTVEVKNGITQYNHLSETQVNAYIKDTTAKQLTAVMFNSTYADIQYSYANDVWVNTGILSMTSEVGNASISDVNGYVDASPSMANVTGYIHTKKPNATSIAETAPTYMTIGQAAIAPSYSFDYTTKNYVAKTDGSNDYCYEDNGTVLISMDEGDTFNWDTSILTATKAGQTLDYTVSMNGTDYTGKAITFNSAGNYTIEYTYKDANNYDVDSDGNITTYEKEYTKSVHISVSVVKADAKNAEFVFGSSNTASKKVTIGNDTYVMPDVATISSAIGSTTVSGQTIYYPIVEMVMSDGKTSHTSAWYAYFPVFKGAVTITDYADGGTGDASVYDDSITTLPRGLSVVGDPSTLFKYQSSSSAGTTPVVKNNILVYSSPSISAKRSEYNTVVQYAYKDNAGTTHYYYIGYHAPAQSYSSICVAPDTEVTLADGTKKEIQHVTLGEELLVWNFETGEYVKVPATLVQDHSTGYMNVLRLHFEDGTEIKILGEHGLFDANENTFVFIDEDDVDNYVGHYFVKQDGDSYKTVKLVDYEVTEEYTTAYTILSMSHYNVLLEDMFTVTPAHVGDNFFNPFEIFEGMKYDKDAMRADIEKYGLYTYEEFAHVLSREQFEALNIAQFKVSVGKGLVTYDGLIYLIENFVNNEVFNR